MSQSSRDVHVRQPDEEQPVEIAPVTQQSEARTPSLLAVPSLLLIATTLSIDPLDELLSLLSGGTYSPVGGKRGGW